MDVAMCRKYKKRKENIYEQQDKADKRRSENAEVSEEVRLRCWTETCLTSYYEKDGVQYKASIGNHKPMNKGFQRRIMKEAAAAAASTIA